MNKWPITKLDSLSKELDFFDKKTIPDPELLHRGLYCPITLSGNYFVRGFSLLEQAKSENIEELFVVELPVMGKKELTTIVLKSEARGGHYSWPEIERILSFLGPKEEGDESIIRLIEGQYNPHFLKNYTIYKTLSSPLKQCINEHMLDFKTARNVRTLPSEVFQLILYHKETNKISFSQIRIILMTLFEISIRDKLTESAIIETCRSILINKQPVDAIKKIRFPKLSALYEDYEKIKDSIVKAKGVSLIEPPFFEGNAFKVEFYFQSKKQLEKRIKVLQELKERTDELFELL